MALKRCIPKFTILKDFRCPEPVISSSAATFIKRCVVCFITDNQCRKMALNPLLRSFRTLTSPHASAGSKRKDHQRAHHTALYIRRQLGRTAVRARSSRWPTTQPLDKCHQDFPRAWRSVQQHQKRWVKQHPQRHKPPHFTVVFVCQCVRVLAHYMHPPVPLPTHSLTPTLFSCRPWRF
jgi:hypothetical protein